MIQRTLYPALKKHVAKEEITLLIGPRQAGKTTLLFLLKKELEERGEKTLFLNLDIEADAFHFGSQSQLLRKIELEIGKKKGYVFIDEIQRKKDAGIFLKGLYDMNLPYKYIVSGSGSLELKEKIHESLSGRKRVFELFTLSFEEFMHYRTHSAYKHKLQEYCEVEPQMARELFEEYMEFGGYPKVVLESTIDEKRAQMNEIFQSYVERDITHLLHIKKTEDFVLLVKLLASQVGQLLNISEISRTLGISLPTVQEYIYYLQKTFILHRVSPFFRNVRKEITKSPMVYFYDLGLRNFSLNVFGFLADMRDKGFLFQNFVHNILTESLRESALRLHYWRTKSGAEVDFIIDNGKELIPVEVKYQSLRKPEMSRSFRSFLEKYRPKRAYIMNLTLQETVHVMNSEVEFLPFYKSPLDSSSKPTTLG